MSSVRRSVGGKEGEGADIGGETLAVLYDGSCDLCRASVRRLERWDSRGALEFLPFQDARVGDRFPWIEAEALSASIHLVGPGGETWAGASAIEEIFRVLPVLRRGVWLFRLPLVRPVVQEIYAWVARNRNRWMCGAHCRNEGAPGSDPGGSRPEAL